MENKEPSFIDLLLEAHIGLDRQGPGSREAMKLALSFLGEGANSKKSPTSDAEPAGRL